MRTLNHLMKYECNLVGVSNGLLLPISKGGREELRKGLIALIFRKSSEEEGS